MEQQSKPTGPEEIYRQLNQEPISARPGEDGPDTNPIAQFNRNQTGLNPDFTVEGMVQPADAEPSPQLAAELNRREFIADEQSGQRFSCRKLNWPPAPDQPVRVMTLPYSASLETGITPYLVEQAAKQIGGSMLVIDNLGLGESSPTTAEQRQQLRREGNFAAVVEPMLRAIKAEGVNQLDVFGFSMGGREAAAMVAAAPELGLHINRAVIVESPGAVELRLPALANRFANKEGQQMHYYHDTTADEALKDALGPAKGQLAEAVGFVRLLQTDLRGNYAYYQALGKGTLGLDLLAGLASNSALHVTLISGSASQLVPAGSYARLRHDLVVAIASAELATNTQSDNIGDVVQQVSELYDSTALADARSTAATVVRRAKDRIRLQILPGDTHAFSEEARRLAGYIAADLNR